MSQLIQIETRWGKPIESNGRKIIVQSRALQINLPILNGGIVWNRPVSVLVLAEQGSDQLVPVRDVTRIVQVLLFVNALVVVGIVRLGMARRTS